MATPTFDASPEAYAATSGDAVRCTLEAGFFARLVPELLRQAGGGRLLDLGCGDGLARRLAGPRLTAYTGVDFRPAAGGAPARGERMLHDLREGRRLLPYRLGSDVTVDPWSPRELCALHREAGLRPVRVLDRTLQPGPKSGEGRYWPGLPCLRAAFADLLAGRDEPHARRVLAGALPPLPAGRAAATHHALGARRRRLTLERGGTPAGLARALWALEAGSGGGFGHGLTVVARKP